MNIADPLALPIRGLRAGHAQDPALASGATVLLFDAPVVAAAHVSGGAPGGFDAALLEPGRSIEQVDAIVLSGGSAFGLEACAGVQAALREAGRGLPVGGVRVPIVVGAILFDLGNGGDKAWGRFSPYRELGYQAAQAAGSRLAEGSVGAGTGATTVTLKGGLGVAHATTAAGHTALAIVAVNALGSATLGQSPHFWAAPLEQGGEFGGLGWPAAMPADALAFRVKGGTTATTIGAVITDAALTRGQAQRLAIMATAGFARAIRPVAAPMDGDTLFAASTGAQPLREPVQELTELGAVAADAVARAVARGVHRATALPFAGARPAWRDLYGQLTPS
jgi:D-aminopeptidase